MEKLFSQSEVDTLIEEIKKNKIIIPKNEAISYDLVNQGKMIRGKLPALDHVNEHFINLYRNSLSNSLRKTTTINIVSTEVLKFSEFVNTVSEESCSGILRFNSLNGIALVVYEKKLLYLMLDSMFGGLNNPYEKINIKKYTKIELSVIKKIIISVIKDLEESWKLIHKLDISFLGIELNPKFIKAIEVNESIVLTTFEVVIEDLTSSMSILIPHSTIEPIKEKLNTCYKIQSHKVDKNWINKIKDNLFNIELNLLVNIGTTDINFNDLVNLNIGDIIPLNQDVDGELDLLVEGVAKFKCFLGVSRGNQAVKVTKYF